MFVLLFVPVLAAGALPAVMALKTSATTGVRCKVIQRNI
jgi:hypothetical protein